MASASLARAREGMLLLEEYVQCLQSEITRKQAVISRLRSSQPATSEQEGTAMAGSKRMSRGVFNAVDLQSFLASPTCMELLGFLGDLVASAKARREGADNRRMAIDDALDGAFRLIDETPPEDFDPQRFGNRAFRKWHAKLCESYGGDEDEFETYFTRSFGDPNRLDYGTGHEAAFFMLMLVVYKQEKNTSILSHFLRITFPRYLQVVRKIRATYRLEPAGSHGVWSLDDYHFLPFVLGSAQLCGGHTKPKDLLHNPTFSELTPDADLFSDALLDILRCKKGPFREHSPLLHSLKACNSWEELNAGLLKMWRGEVLGKFPVAQHFYFGPSLPITWTLTPTNDMDEDMVTRLQQQQQHHNDPLAKYFQIDQTVLQQSMTIDPARAAAVAQQQVADLPIHTIRVDGSGIDISGWSIVCVNESKISGETEIEALRAAFPTELDFPFPEMLFSGNYLRLEHAPVSMEFRVDEALRGCKLRSTTDGAPDRKLIKVTMADKWEKRRDQDGNPIKTWREDYDWTFTTRRLITCKTLQDPTAEAKQTRTPRRIDYERLKRREPILWAKEIILFEDDLFDLGISKLTVKIRVMPSCFFVLARFFLRVDGSYVRIIDSRVFHIFGQRHVLIEHSEREAEMASLGATVETKDLIDPNFVATILPVSVEPVTYEIALTT